MRKLIATVISFSICAMLLACQGKSESSQNEKTDSESQIESNVSDTMTEAATESSDSSALQTETTSLKAITEQSSAAVTDKTSAVTTNKTTIATSAVTSAASVVTTVATAPITKKVTIPEGYSFAQIAALLEKNGVCTKQQLLDTINSYDYSYYSLIGALGNDANRCFKLEGYLFPDTYEFYVDQNPEDVLGKFLKNSENKLTDQYRQRASELGYSMDQIITLASIIEKEIGNQSQMKTVASVFYNRIKAGQKLQCDSSINYIEWYVKPYISGDINRYNSFYNTYKCSALPEGAICNPGITAIEAALYPDTTDYLYFASDKAGNYYYAATYEEHLKNCETANVTTTS